MHDREQMSGEVNVFGDYAVPMRRLGYAVLPANGKAPLRNGFNKWKQAPGEKTIAKWAQRNPGADMVIVPGLSKARRDSFGLVVVDADDEEAKGQAIELFG